MIAAILLMFCGAFDDGKVETFPDLIWVEFGGVYVKMDKAEYRRMLDELGIKD